MKTAVRNALILALGYARRIIPHPSLRRRIIALHDIPQAHERLFEEKMAWLKTHCRVVSLDDLAARRGLDSERLNIALTFDDGFKEYAAYVAPTLSRMGLPATFFIPSGALGISGEEAERFSRDGLRRSRSFAFMTHDDLKALARNPLFDIGGHTTHHKDVATLDERGLEEEVAADKRSIEAIIGRPIRWFAYPFGGVENVSLDAMRAESRCGYSSAFTIIPSFWTEDAHRLLVGRDSMSVADPIALWDAWLSGGYDALSRMKARGGLAALAREFGRAA